MGSNRNFLAWLVTSLAATAVLLAALGLQRPLSRSEMRLGPAWRLPVLTTEVMLDSSFAERGLSHDDVDLVLVGRIVEDGTVSTAELVASPLYDEQLFQRIPIEVPEGLSVVDGRIAESAGTRATVVLRTTDQGGVTRFHVSDVGLAQDDINRPAQVFEVPSGSQIPDNWSSAPATDGELVVVGGLRSDDGSAVFRRCVLPPNAESACSDVAVPGLTVGVVRGLDQGSTLVLATDQNDLYVTLIDHRSADSMEYQTATVDLSSVLVEADAAIYVEGIEHPSAIAMTRLARTDFAIVVASASSPFASVLALSGVDRSDFEVTVTPIAAVTTTNPVEEAALDVLPASSAADADLVGLVAWERDAIRIYAAELNLEPVLSGHRGGEIPYLEPRREDQGVNCLQGVPRFAQLDAASSAYECPGRTGFVLHESDAVPQADRSALLHSSLRPTAGPLPAFNLAQREHDGSFVIQRDGRLIELRPDRSDGTVFGPEDMLYSLLPDTNASVLEFDVGFITGPIVAVDGGDRGATTDEVVFERLDRLDQRRLNVEISPSFGIISPPFREDGSIHIAAWTPDGEIQFATSLPTSIAGDLLTTCDGSEALTLLTVDDSDTLQSWTVRPTSAATWEIEGPAVIPDIHPALISSCASSNAAIAISTRSNLNEYVHVLRRGSLSEPERPMELPCAEAVSLTVSEDSIYAVGAVCEESPGIVARLQGGQVDTLEIPFVPVAGQHFGSVFLVQGILQAVEIDLGYGQ